MTISTGRNAKRTSTGCLTCRRRKKKCDEQHPICLACSKNNIQCTWGQQRRKQRLHRPQAYNRDFEIPQELSHCINVFAAPSMNLQERLISHFVKYCPVWIASIRVLEGSNFLVHFIPIAMRNALVMECVLAVAAGDLGKIGRESIELQSISNYHYARASVGLSAAITKEMGPGCDQEILASDETLCAVLLLCVHEAVNFTSLDRLLIHINGAITLISNRINYAPENPDLRGFLLELFCYFFTLAASTHGSRINSNDEFAYRVFHSPFLQSHQSRGMLLGSESEIFHIILRLSVTVNRHSIRPSNQTSLEMELSAIQSDLWRVSIHTNPDQILGTENVDCSAELHITSNLYYLACQLLLWQVMHSGTSIYDELARETLARFFETLERLPDTSSANGVLCWPLFIAGLSLNTGKYRSATLSRLKLIETGWRSAIALQASKHLIKRWKECREGVDIIMSSDSCSSVGILPMILV